MKRFGTLVAMLLIGILAVTLMMPAPVSAQSPEQCQGYVAQVTLDVQALNDIAQYAVWAFGGGSCSDALSWLQLGNMMIQDAHAIIWNMPVSCWDYASTDIDLDQAWDMINALTTEIGTACGTGWPNWN